MIPERLYGRARETDILLAAFERVVTNGSPELLLVSGFPGTGKSSVVNELNEALVSRRGLFTSGKFEQYKRDIPYDTLAQAFRRLVHPLLAKSHTELQEWRDLIQDALDPNGLLILDLVPELQLIIGEQPPVPDLPPHDAQRRFHLLLRRFIGVFARQNRPLVLFLDDLQWLDAATLDFLEDILRQPDVRHLLLIGAYRDNELSAVHPLMRRLEAIRASGATVHQIVLAPLSAADLQHLIADSLHSTPKRVAPLAQLVHEKTGGNPFFAIQFLTTLGEEGLLRFNQRHVRWCWDVARIHGKGYTDNVVDLMVAKLMRLPVETREVLQQLACVGESVELSLLKLVVQASIDETHQHLWEAVRAGLVVRSERSYRFLHDRIQEAAYSLIPEASRAGAHLRIGRLLAANTPREMREEGVFAIVNQLNRASHLITSPEERGQVAELNFIAGRRAKTSTAYASALSYLAAGRALLTDESWNERYDLIFSIEYLTAECEVLTARMEAAEQRLSMLAERANSARRSALICRLRITLYTALDRSDRSVEICREYLRRYGTDWPVHPTSEDVRREYDRIWFLLGSRQIEALLDLPWMTNPEVLDALEVLAETVTPAVFFDQNFCSLVICRMVNLSLEHGNSDASCFAYVWFGVIAGPQFGKYEHGFRFGRLGYELVERRGLKRYQARTYMSFGNLIIPWVKHALEGRDLIRRAFDAAYRIGDFTFAGYSLQQLVTSFLAVGDRLDEVQQEAENGVAFAKSARFGLVVDLITSQLQLVRTLRGLTPSFGCFDDAEFSEAGFEQHLASNPGLVDVEFGYWGLKTQARFLCADYSAAVEASFKAQPLFWAAPSLLEPSAFRYYAALSHAAFWDSSPADQKQKHFEALLTLHGALQVCAAHCAANFENRAALVGAEIARIEGRVLDAERLYEQAIRSAQENGFVHNEAVASEVAGRFYLSRGLETTASAHLRNAAGCFALWGAHGKVKQMELRYARLASTDTRRHSAIPGPSTQQLDVATVLKASQAVSGEIVLPRLVERLMTITLQNAGADRGLLVLSRGGEYRVEAEALMSGDKVVLHQGRDSDPSMPETIARYVVRTREKVILDDAARPHPFGEDEYVSNRKPRSLLCLPLLRQGMLSGLLYLENTLTSHAFTPALTAVLELLASQAAISLENSRLYGDLQEREAKVRRLVDANIIGIFIWNLNGRILDANEAFLRIVGYSREELVSGHMNWRMLTPAAWRDADERHMPELMASGTVQPYEKEYIHKTGKTVPVLIGGAYFEGGQDEGVAFVVDLTDLKKAERMACENERRFREAEVALAHANRIATMGQMSASIVHEISQPMAAAMNNAEAALRWLSGQSPNLERAILSITRVIQNGAHACEVIARVRALAKRAPPKKDWLAINEAIREVVALIHGEVVKHRVSVQTQLAEALPPIQGDRVQLQQVMLNLMLNSVEAMSGVGVNKRELKISTDQTEADVLVAVQDTGPGLPPETLDRVFETFYSTKPGGLGLGLSICSSIVEAHGGRLWASAGELHGATFQFTLPVHPNTDESVS